ncbi:MAG TPA: hypothetical protein VKD71_12960 [Gemmataceae bacterium]|nr:hypothetical protein [Gemmataceae bacterium]
MKPVAFTPNPGKMGFLELYRVAGSPVVGFIACGLKLFRILGPQHDGYGIRSLGDELERRDIGNLPKHVLEATEGYRDKLERLGFIPCFAYSLETYGAQEGHAIPHRHKSGVAAANVLYTRCVRDDNETMATTFAFNTPLADDTYIVTSGLKKQMRKPPHFLIKNMPGKSPKEVFERHIERLEQANALPRTIKTDDELAQLVLNCEHDDTEFNFERGVYVRMTRDDIELGKELQEEYQEENSGRPRRRRRYEDDEEEDDYEDEDEEYEDDDRPRRRR